MAGTRCHIYVFASLDSDGRYGVVEIVLAQSKSHAIQSLLDLMDGDRLRLEQYRLIRDFRVEEGRIVSVYPNYPEGFLGDDIWLEYSDNVVEE